MGYNPDDTDWRIINKLIDDARNTSAVEIAEELDVSPGTVRYRINRLEEEDIIQGYTAQIDFEKAGGYLVGIYMCTVPAAKQERLALTAQTISGVVNVRMLMAGRRDLHVVAVGKTTEDLRRIARELSHLDIKIEDEELLQTELQSTYDPNSIASQQQSQDQLTVTSLANGAHILEISVDNDAPIIGQTITQANKQDTIGTDMTILAVKRDDTVLSTDDNVTIQAGDIMLALFDEQLESQSPASFMSGTLRGLIGD